MYPESSMAAIAATFQCHHTTIMQIVRYKGCYEEIY